MEHQSQPALRLHQIHPTMSFGHTSYVPEEETRNLRASFPEADALQPFRELCTSPDRPVESFDISDSTMSRDVVEEYCKNISSSNLSHPNYRQLAWSSGGGDDEDSLDMSRRMRIPKTPIHSSMYVSGKLPSLRSELSGFALEKKYRMGNAVPFCLNPNAAYLMQHASITEQQKRVEHDLGTCLFFLNDRAYLRRLENRLRQRFDDQSDMAHRYRRDEELRKKHEQSKSELFSVGRQLTESPDPCADEPAHIRMKKKSSAKEEVMHKKSILFTSVSSKPSKGDAAELTSAQLMSGALLQTKSSTRAQLREVKLTQSDSARSKTEEADASSLSNVDMLSLYDQAEQSVQAVPPLTKRTVKCRTMSSRG